MNDEAKDNRLQYLYRLWNELDLERLRIESQDEYPMYSLEDFARLRELRDELKAISDEIDELDPPAESSDMSAGWEY